MHPRKSSTFSSDPDDAEPLERTDFAICLKYLERKKNKTTNFQFYYLKLKSCHFHHEQMILWSLGCDWQSEVFIRHVCYLSGSAVCVHSFMGGWLFCEQLSKDKNQMIFCGINKQDIASFFKQMDTTASSFNNCHFMLFSNESDHFIDGFNLSSVYCHNTDWVNSLLNQLCIRFCPGSEPVASLHIKTNSKQK